MARRLRVFLPQDVSNTNDNPVIIESCFCRRVKFEQSAGKPCRALLGDVAEYACMHHGRKETPDAKSSCRQTRRQTLRRTPRRRTLLH